MTRLNVLTCDEMSSLGEDANGPADPCYGARSASRDYRAGEDASNNLASVRSTPKFDRIRQNEAQQGRA
jgi:hypothetical protein